VNGRFGAISPLLIRLARVMRGRRSRRAEKDLSPRTRRALGMIKPPEGRTDRELVEEALLEKYVLDR
jgi:hypothetical protein